MPNKPTSDDSSSISNQPLIPKQGEQKNYEAAVGALMSSYGFSSTVAVPVTQKKKDKKQKSGRYGLSKESNMIRN